MHRRYLLISFLLAAVFANGPALSGETTAPAPARTGFDVLYAAAVDATQKKNWLEASNFINDALRLLGDSEHPNKRVAQLLQTAAAHEYKKENVLYTANELLRLRNWAGAEAAFGEAVGLWGMTDAIQRGLATLQAGAIEDNKHLQRAINLIKQKEYDGALLALDQAQLGLGEMAFIVQKRAETQQAREVSEKLARAKLHTQQGEWDAARNIYGELEPLHNQFPDVAAARAEFDKLAREARFRSLLAAAQEELAQGNDDPPQASQADDDPELKERLVKAIQSQRRALQNNGAKKKAEEF
jgi:hypothetical protein